MTLTLESMKEEHIPEVVEIERSSFGTPWAEMSFLNEIHSPNSHAYVYLLDSKVVGYVCTKHIRYEGHILNLAVHQEFRRQGIAKTMVSKGIEELRAYKCMYVYLEVRASNYPAIKLYEGFGFKAAGIRKAYYLSPVEDALVMMFKL